MPNSFNQKTDNSLVILLSQKHAIIFSPKTLLNTILGETTKPQSTNDIFLTVMWLNKVILLADAY